ncbi:MAG TPA: A/G-specific adenine glycosylase, partial [Flammeovirgaceae bacterium]|nr:A/G-specific adenine glycosylase [Flammeovirgaceae bacterium]
MTAHPFTVTLLHWYRQHQRALPWRHSRDPYRIWLAEVIMQQTRISQGLPYYQRFIAAYPTLAELAAAPPDEVLRLWQGLGYYSRARHLHKCAQVVWQEHRGQWPRTAAGLQQLPGIGPYTAAAIAAQAFDEPVPVVDGNVYRVLARHFGLATPINTPAARKEFTTLSASLLNPACPGDYNQALMEFGALQCTPQKPACDTCVLALSCVARQQGRQHELPVKASTRTIRQRYFTYLVVQQNGQLLLRQRPDGDIWQGLYEFVLIETAQKPELQKLAHPLLQQAGHQQAEPIFYRHQLTHRILNVNFVAVSVSGPSQ